VSGVSVLAGLPIGGLSLLLGAAGWGKLRRPGPAAAAWATAAGAWATAAGGAPADVARARLAVRALAIVELAIAIVAIAAPGRAGAALLAVTYAGLGAGAAVAARRLARHPCGCFGDADGAPLGRRHVAIDLAGAAIVAAGALATRPPDGPARLILAHPGIGAAALAAEAAIAGVLAPALNGGRARGGLDRSATRLIDASARLLEARISRRSALARLAVAGSALAVAPLRYLLYPGRAMAVVVPGDCSDGLCTDGYTAFCCEINQGLNSCPEGTFTGGWWMCTDYQGTQLCRGDGVRYYVDCNALPGTTFPGGCRCGGDTCAQRRVACNIFRYGQCNGEIAGTTAVVCRMVTCENPGLIPDLHCSSAVMVDDAVCAHEAGCLEPMAQQLPGAGGAWVTAR
jgi:hypothetical protein